MYTYRQAKKRKIRYPVEGAHVRVHALAHGQQQRREVRAAVHLWEQHVAVVLPR